MQEGVGGLAGREAGAGGAGERAEDEAGGAAGETHGVAERRGVAEAGDRAAEAGVLIGGEWDEAPGEGLDAQLHAGAEPGEEAAQREVQGPRGAVAGGEDRREAERGQRVVVGEAREVGEAGEAGEAGDPARPEIAAVEGGGQICGEQALAEQQGATVVEAVEQGVGERVIELVGE